MTLVCIGVEVNSKMPQRLSPRAMAPFSMMITGLANPRWQAILNVKISIR